MHCPLLGPHLLHIVLRRKARACYYSTTSYILLEATLDGGGGKTGMSLLHPPITHRVSASSSGRWRVQGSVQRIPAPPYCLEQSSSKHRSVWGMNPPLNSSQSFWRCEMWAERSLDASREFRSHWRVGPGVCRDLIYMFSYLSIYNI